MPRAGADIEEIYAYIAHTLQAPHAAEALLGKIDTAINSIPQNPYLYPKSYNEILAAKGYHRVIVKNYLIFYLIDDTERTVNIMRVLYGSRDLEELL
jgi:plasmid stabilization system protein ParE